MIRKLRLKIVGISVIAVAVLLVSVLAAVALSTRSQMVRASESRLQEALAGHMLSSAQPGSGGGQPCFVADIYADGTVRLAGSGYYDLDNDALILSIVQDALQRESREGVLQDYALRYMRQTGTLTVRLAFTDCSQEQATMRSLLLRMGGVSLAALLLLTGVSYWLAGFAVKPVQQAWQEQKQFVSDASHELKTPLASIRLMTDSILQDASIDRETTREFVADISDAADRLIHISQELLELDRLDQGRDLDRRAIDLNEQAEQIGRMLAPLAESAQVTMTLTLGEGCLVRCNDKDAGQILKNLMENAIKYNVLHGQVDVTTRRVGDKVTLSVADTGVGIPEADMPRIFERFYRVDKARSRAAGGTGLGLSIVRDAVKRHGGEITVQAGQPAGTIFTVTLPAWTGEGETT